MSNKNRIIIIIIISIIPLAFLTLEPFLINNHQNWKVSLAFKLETPIISAQFSWIANGTAICTEDGAKGNIQICSDGAGGAILAWEDRRGGIYYDIYAQRIGANGNVLWTANGTEISTANENQRFPQMVEDSAGGAIIIWRDKRSGTEYDIYAQRIDANGNIQWTPNGTAIIIENDGQEGPQMISDGTGGAIITWQDWRNGLNTDIYAQRIDSNGNLLWAANGTAISTASDNQEWPHLCSDGSQGAIIAWRDNRTGIDYDLYVQRINSNGSVLWMANGTEISTTNDHQGIFFSICSDEVGGAIIAWEDSRNWGTSFSDIYAQRINSNGIVLWTANGTAICTESSANQLYPEICSDGAEGAFIVWDDRRDILITGVDIYIDRVYFNGTTKWGPYGRGLRTVSPDQYGIVLKYDGVGGAIITWYENGEIYTQRVNSEVNRLWDPNGEVICNATGTQRLPQVYSDEEGRAIFAWEDERNGIDTHIYAQAIDDIVIPTSNQPEDITISIDGSETIDWILYDDYGGGQYQVLTNDTDGNFYEWVDWTPWNNNTPINIAINLTVTGVYNYTIEYYDNQNQFGVPDTVLVTITKADDDVAIPFGNYYMVFFAIGVVSLIIINKRRLLN